MKPKPMTEEKKHHENYVHQVEQTGSRISTGHNILGREVTCKIQDWNCEGCEYKEIQIDTSE